MKVFVEVVPLFQSTQGCLVAAPDRYKAVLEAFIGFISPLLTGDIPPGSLSVTWISVANVKPAECEAISVTHANNNGRAAWTTFWRFWLQRQFWSYQIETQDARASQFCQEFLRGVCAFFESHFLNVRKKESLSWPDNLYHNGVEDATIGF